MKHAFEKQIRQQLLLLEGQEEMKLVSFDQTRQRAMSVRGRERVRERREKGRLTEICNKNFTARGVLGKD